MTFDPHPKTIGFFLSIWGIYVPCLRTARVPLLACMRYRVNKQCHKHKHIHPHTHTHTHAIMNAFLACLPQGIKNKTIHLLHLTETCYKKLSYKYLYYYVKSKSMMISNFKLLLPLQCCAKSVSTIPPSPLKFQFKILNYCRTQYCAV